MRSISAETLALLDEGRITQHACMEIESDPIIRVWSGYGSLTVGGDAYTGIGASNLAPAFTSQIGQGAEPVTLTLSGIDPTWIPTVLETDMRGRFVRLTSLLFDEHGTELLETVEEFFGTVDTITTSLTPGEDGDASVIFGIESEARGAGRSGGRLAAGPDQRLIDADDGSMDAMSTAPDIQLYWDGTEPQRASVALK